MSDIQESKIDYMCDYGCGQVANYPPGKGRKYYCCSIIYQKCPGFARTVSKKILEKIRKRKKIRYSNSIPVSSPDIICEYGCGQPALFFFPRIKKYCCAYNAHKCPVKRAESSEVGKTRTHTKETREKISKQKKGVIVSEKTREKIRRTLRRTRAIRKRQEVKNV